VKPAKESKWFRNRIETVAEDESLKLGTVISHAPGVRGRSLLRAIVDRKTAEGWLVYLAHGKLL
jgi:hypothetical protein